MNIKNKSIPCRVKQLNVLSKRPVHKKYVPQSQERISFARPRMVSNQSVAIRVEHLTKRFGEAVAVDSINFEVTRGDTCALLGGNGAGKTTIIAMLLGLLTPTSGCVQVMGVDMFTDRYRVLPKMNFSSPYVDLPKRLKVEQNLRVYGRLYGVRDLRNRLHTLAEDLQLEELMSTQFGALSAGQKTRVSLAKALINEPELLLLDEPTASLDPDTADRIRSYLEHYRSHTGATILIASHNMAEVERMCSDVIMIKQGKVVSRGSPDELIARHGGKTMEEVFLDVARGQSIGAVENA